MATDSFVGSVGTDLPTHNATWAATSGKPSLTLTGSGAARGSAGGAFNYWNATFASAHSSEATLTTIGSSDNPGLLVRCQSNGDTFYAIFSGSDSLTYCGQRISGTFTDWAAVSGGANGDTFRFEVDTSVTTTIRLYANNVLLQTFTGKNALSNGAPGVFSDSANGTVGPWTGIDTPAGSSTTVTPGVGSATLSGKTPTTSSFANVRIREVLINASGQPISNATGIDLLVWYAGYPNGAPDLSYSSMTTDAAGTTSWSIATGSLAYQQPIFYVATSGDTSVTAYTCARLIPSYE